MEELLEDYKDFLELNNLEIWERGDRRLRGYRIFVKEDGKPKPPIPPLPQDRELVTNVMIDLITRTNYLLDRQIGSLEEKHKKEGGFTEKLYQRRKDYRGD